MFIFNGQLLLDTNGFAASSIKGGIEKFSTASEMRKKLKSFTTAMTDVGRGTIRDIGKITDRKMLNNIVNSAQKDELVLIETDYSLFSNMDDFVQFCRDLRKSKTLIMVGFIDRDNEDNHPQIIW